MWLEDCDIDNIIRFGCAPTELHTLYTDQENTVWSLIDDGAIDPLKAGNLPFHAASSF